MSRFQVPSNTASEKSSLANISDAASVEKTITYAYDALKRLISATYSDGSAFQYTYDAAGNVLEYTATVNGQAKTTTYTYDAANQLLTATQAGITWYYEYDGNGSLIQATPGEEVVNGARRYGYNTAGYLTKIETHDGMGWLPQAEMAYDGLGNRLAMTGYAGEQSVITQYSLDSGQTLLATTGEMTTAYLYGSGVIGEQTDVWVYDLADGMNTTRQLANSSGEVTLATSYTPWGDTLEIHGTGSFTFGYFGGIMDSATGLLYVGGGQYYDPQTGRFLNRNAKPNQANPYVPWRGDPTGAAIAPLALLALVYGRKKNRGKWDSLIILLVLCGTVVMSLSACSSTNTSSPIAITVTRYVETPTPTVTVTQGATVIASSPTPSETPTLTPSATCTVMLTPTPTATQMPDLLNIALLRDISNIKEWTSRTGYYGKNYYDWYKKLWEDKTWWWWKGHETFSTWDLFTLIIHIEIDQVGDPGIPGMYAGYPIYKEAVVREAYDWCKGERIQSPPPNTPEGALNWLAEYSESGGRQIRGGGSIEQKPHPFGPAEEITTAMRDSSSDWAQGFSPNRPYGVGNASLFRKGYLETAVKLHMIAWKSNDDSDAEVIIPTGCGAYYLYSKENAHSAYENLGCGVWPTPVPDS